MPIDQQSNTMTVSKLDHLPSEILQHVAACVRDIHRPSLSSMALANETCHAAILPSMFRIVRLKVGRHKNLREDAEEWLSVLRRNHALQHVRRLEIHGRLLLRADEQEKPDELPERAYASYRGIDNDYGPSHHKIYGHFADDGPIEVPFEEDQAWSPVIDLVKALPHLTELVFDCSNQFPPSLLDALHTSQPRCRLALNDFRFRSLREDAVSAHEMAIATSPCLHSVNIRYAWCDSNSNADYNEDAIMRVVAGLAPNLKEVVLVHCRPSLPGGEWVDESIPREPWNGFSADISEPITGRLTSLTLLGDGLVKPSVLEAWSTHTDFDVLRFMRLTAGVDEEALNWLTANCSFASLKQLEIQLMRDDDEGPKPGFDDAAVSFLTSLQPLESLALMGSLEPQLFSAALNIHGRTLRKLLLDPFESMSSTTKFDCVYGINFSKEDILQIEASCPLLEILEIPVKRTKGDVLEVELYETLGKIRQLRSLFLVLNCADPSVTLEQDTEAPNDPSFDKFDQQLFWDDAPQGPRNGHFRDALMNAALDEVLARSIWSIIDENKVGCRLQSLQVRTKGAGTFAIPSWQLDFLTISMHISRVYRLQRNSLDPDRIDATELSRYIRMRDERTHHSQFRQREFLESRMMQLFRRIWPEKDGSDDWKDDWSSLPLQR